MAEHSGVIDSLHCRGSHVAALLLVVYGRVTAIRQGLTCYGGPCHGPALQTISGMYNGQCIKKTGIHLVHRRNQLPQEHL